eukprot:COSAG06_NODE_5832_length_3253_cov_4.584337_3_plen_396_part_00
MRQQTGLGESAPTVGFADDTKDDTAPKKLVRQQTGLGESAPTVGFADDTKDDTAPKKLVRQQTGLGESAPTVGFADDTKDDMAPKKLVRQQTGLGESAAAIDDAEEEDYASDFDDGDEDEDENATEVAAAPLPPLFRAAAQQVTTSVDVLNKLQETAKVRGAASVADRNATDAHVVPAVAVAAVEEVVEALECRMDDLKEDMKQVRATLEAAILTAADDNTIGLERPQEEWRRNSKALQNGSADDGDSLQILITVEKDLRQIPVASAARAEFERAAKRDISYTLGLPASSKASSSSSSVVAPALAPPIPVQVLITGLRSIKPSVNTGDYQLRTSAVLECLVQRSQIAPLVESNNGGAAGAGTSPEQEFVRKQLLGGVKGTRIADAPVKHVELRSH